MEVLTWVGKQVGWPTSALAAEHSRSIVHRETPPPFGTAEMLQALRPAPYEGFLVGNRHGGVSRWTSVLQATYDLSMMLLHWPIHRGIDFLRPDTNISVSETQ